ncbi:hypothetical protein [Nonomuraea sp. NPDC049480]|uniref:hypothetical protein n=1 Tax=Nonomuraea sp. NPDC049480 TaxID=3364353 RepID=UPI0037991E70
MTGDRPCFRERNPSVRWVLPEGHYNPVPGEGMRWLDQERAVYGLHNLKLHITV